MRDDLIWGGRIRPCVLIGRAWVGACTATHATREARAHTSSRNPGTRVVSLAPSRGNRRPRPSFSLVRREARRAAWEASLARAKHDVTHTFTGQLTHPPRISPAHVYGPRAGARADRAHQSLCRLRSQNERRSQVAFLPAPVRQHARAHHRARAPRHLRCVAVVITGSSSGHGI